MNKPSSIGKKHVLEVSQVLRNTALGLSTNMYPKSAVQTADFINKIYPNIECIITKFETNNPDGHPDLLVTLEDKQEIKINLFFIKGSGNIQPKNLGAKSFLKKYFNSNGLQLYFNDYLNMSYKEFLKELIETKGECNLYDSVKIMKHTVNQHYPNFEKGIGKYRKSFLFDIREKCFSLLKNEYNKGCAGIQNAFTELMLMDSTNIITRSLGKSERFNVELWNSNIDSDNDTFIYKKGNDTVGIRSGQEALTLRFKFESGPTSSVKIATSYEKFPVVNDIVAKNTIIVKEFESILQNHKQTEKKNTSNAIGKCNEAMVYYSLLKRNPTINQVDEKECLKMIEKYSPIVASKVINEIRNSSNVTAEKIQEYLERNYESYTLEGIQLVPDSYISNRLDTSDLELIIRSDKHYISEYLSLKAISKTGTSITIKNPGIGQILGPQYFDVGSLSLIVDATKKQFNKNLINHQQSLENVSIELGRSLENIPQFKLKKGVLALMGNCTMVITMYGENNCVVLEHKDIVGDISVLLKTPSLKQTTLRWNNDGESLSLRVKFSAGKTKGWSSLKLACQYRI